ncbi:flippase-like domain-containing protein [Nitriliruptoraceae bacterium ZYF776]|nr:flippase-like domain-containing protein [Profundirhabdus halotolerans]
MDLLTPLLALDPTLVVVAVGLLVAGESAALLGLVVPGEVALLGAGALAAGGHLPVAWLLVAGVIGAVVGQLAGYGLGHRWGTPLLARATAHPRLARHLPRAEALVRGRGVAVVLLSRWAGPMRALVPLLVGSTRMPLGRYLAASLVGGIAWIGAVTGAGWLAARGTASAAGWLGWGSTVVVTVVVGVAVLAWLRAGAGTTSTSPRPWAAVGRAGIHRARRIAWPVLATGLGVAAVVLLVGSVGTDAIGDALTRLDGRLLTAAVALKAVAVAALVQVHRASYRLAGAASLGYREAVPVALGAFSLTQVLPGGGVAGGLYAQRRLRLHGADPVAATAGVLVFGTVNLGTLALGVGVATSLAAVVTPRYAGYAVISLAVTAVLGGALLATHAVTTRPAWRAAVARWLARRSWRGRPVASGWVATLSGPAPIVTPRQRDLLVPARWAALGWVADVAVLLCLVHAAGGEPPVLGVLVAFAAAHLLAGVPVTPGGLGVVEAGVAGTLVAFGVSPAVAAVTVVGHRLVSSVLPVLVGAPLVLRSLRRAPATPTSPGAPVSATAPVSPSPLPPAARPEEVTPCP